MSMTQLTALHQHLVNLDLVAAENIESFADEPRIVPSGKMETVITGVNQPGIVLYRQTYTATFFIERYPFNEHPVEELFGQVAAYLLENGNGTGEIPHPETDVEILDDNTADIEFSVEFEQDVYAVEDPAGPIVLRGKNYAITTPVVDIATEADITT